MALNLLVLRTEDLDGMRCFYEALGLQFAKHKHGNGPTHFACEAPHSCFELYRASPAFPPTSPLRLGFVVPSVADALQATRNHPKAAVVQEPVESPWGLRTVVRDRTGFKAFRSYATRLGPFPGPSLSRLIYRTIGLVAYPNLSVCVLMAH